MLVKRTVQVWSGDSTSGSRAEAHSVLSDEGILRLAIGQHYK